MERKKIIDYIRRAVPVLAAMLLLVAVASPAYAATGDSWRLPIPFSEISLLHGGEQISTVATFPFPVSSDGAYSVSDGSYALDLRSASNGSNISITYDIDSLSSVSGIRLVARDFVWPASQMEALGEVFQFLFYSSSGLKSGDLLISLKTSGLYVAYNSLGGYFFPETNSHSWNRLSSFNLLEFYDVNSSNPRSMIYVDELVLTFTFNSSVSAFNIWAPSNSPTASFDDWANSWGLSFDSVIYEPADPGDLSFGWLITSVSNVLSIQLWPGFSIGGLLRIIFIVGFLFWFLKLTF